MGRKLKFVEFLDFWGRNNKNLWNFLIFGVEFRINLRNFQRKIEKKLREKLREKLTKFREKFREILDFLDHPLKFRNIQEIFERGKNQNY